LLWLEEDRGLHAWQPAATTPKPIYDNEEVIRTTLQVSPRHWHPGDDGTMLLLMTHSVVAFRLRDGGAAPLGRLDAFFGGDVWRALWRRERDHWLVEGLPSREMLVRRGDMGRLCCAPDGRGHFFAASAAGEGQIFNLATLQLTPIRDCPHMPNIAAGDAEGGCWFSDRQGDIYFSDITGRCRRVAAVELPEPRGAQLHNCGQYLVWTGFTSQWFPETGVELARTLVFFQKSLSPEPKLDRLGVQVLHPREGICVALCYDAVRDRLVTVWTVEGRGEYRLRLGSIGEFVAWSITERDLPSLDPLRCHQAVLSTDGKWLGVLCGGGELAYVNVETGGITASLAGSVPFIAVETAPGEAKFWLVEAHGRVYRCELRQSL